MRLAWVLLPMVTVASCGARTGLLAPEPPIDAGVDANMPVGCMPGTFTLMKAQPTIMFVLDRSGSMGMRFSGNSSRWQVLTSGLQLALPPVDMTMQIGALLFPSSSGDMTCSVAGAPNILPGLGHTKTLLDLMTKTQPGGSTPTADAVDTAAKAILGVRAASTARALVLATDGGPNCNTTLDPKTCTCLDARGCGNRANNCLDDKRTVERITNIWKQGLPTYVIGIQNPGETQNNIVLDEMADAGGRPKSNGAHHFYAATSEPELDAALVAIRDQLGACTYLTISVPDPSGTISVSIDGVTIPFDGSAMSGWHWADRSNGEIVFSGDTCSKIAASASPNVLVTVTCGMDGGADSASDAVSDAPSDAVSEQRDGD